MPLLSATVLFVCLSWGCNPLRITLENGMPSSFHFTRKTYQMLIYHKSRKCLRTPISWVLSLQKTILVKIFYRVSQKKLHHLKNCSIFCLRHWSALIFSTLLPQIYPRLPGKNLKKGCIFCGDLKFQTQKYDTQSEQRKRI